jgi:hypothetical protein
MTTKSCIRCGICKPLSEFYRHDRMADGTLNKCKQCCKREAGMNRMKNHDRYKRYDMLRSNEPHRSSLRKRVVSEYRANHPDRVAANNAVRNAVLNGSLQKTPCIVCGDSAVAHHADYSRPLDVVWLCQMHHKQTHAMAAKLIAQYGVEAE